MAKYINLEKVMTKIRERIENPTVIGWLMSILIEQSVADVQEVRHGKWEDKGICHNYPKDGVNKYHLLICSRCGCMHRARKHENGVFINANYCPNCGCKMDGEENG